MLLQPTTWFRSYLPGRPSYLQASTAPAANSDLGPRQLALYGERVTVWRPLYSTGANRKEQPPSWLPQITDLACHIGPRPSQYELQDFILSEGDNIFTLDKISFGLAVTLLPEDVLYVTSGHPKKLGGWWKIRGDLQPLTTFANKQAFIAARLPQAPAGIPV
jgi:hypothetical protein